MIKPSFIKKLGLCILKSKSDTQKIDSFKLKIFRIVITSFSLDDNVKRSQFFEKTLLLANINMDVALEMSFLTLSNAEIHFTIYKLNLRLYITYNILLTI